MPVKLNTGALIAGVLGTHKFVYDVWGDTVNTAKRMESYGLPGRVHGSVATRRALGEAFRFEPRGALVINHATQPPKPRAFSIFRDGRRV